MNIGIRGGYASTAKGSQARLMVDEGVGSLGRPSFDDRRAEPAGDVQGEMEVLAKEVAALHAAVDSLLDRLSPVLRPQELLANQPKEEATPRRAPSTPIGMGLRDQSDRVMMIRQSVEAATEGLGL